MFYQLFNLIFSWFALVRVVFLHVELLLLNMGQANCYIAFAILTSALEDYIPSFHYPNLVLNYFYLGLLIMCFLLSLGNRPQGAKWAYTLALLGFSLLTMYTTVHFVRFTWVKFLLTPV